MKKFCFESMMSETKQRIKLMKEISIHVNQTSGKKFFIM